MGRKFLGAIGLAMALVAGACGGDKEPSGAAAAGESDGESTTGDVSTTEAPSGEEVADAVEPCALVSEADVSAILGTAVVASEQPNVSGGVVCHWAPAADDPYTVRLTVGPPDLYELLRSNEFTDLPGIGEEAWSNAYVSAGVPALDVGVRTADHHVLLFFAETDDLAVGTELTEAVVDALPA